MDKKISITKVDDEKRLVFGFFNINKIRGELVEDLQGDLISTEVLEKAVYDFVLNARVQGESHTRMGVGRLVESFMITKQKLESMSKSLTSLGIKNLIEIECEGWFGGFKITDEKVWKDVKEGKLPAFSIGGKGKRIPLED
jgi:hypothetical protein